MQNWKAVKVKQLFQYLQLGDLWPSEILIKITDVSADSLTKKMLKTLHCKIFPKRYAWISVTFLGFISFEQVTGNNRLRTWNVPDFRNLVDLNK